MAVPTSNSLIPTKSLLPTNSLLSSSNNLSQCSFPGKPGLMPKTRPISAVDNSAVSTKKQQPATVTTTTREAAKWTVESWKSKKALQLPEYPSQESLDTVLKTLEAFPPIVFAGEARNLEERLGDAALGKAFLLQGGDCAESFKEFNATNIRDTFRVILQMGVVMMFGGQVPVIKVGPFFNSPMLFYRPFGLSL